MKKSTVILMWGAITGLVNSAFYQVIDVANNPNRSVQYLAYLIIFGGLLAGTLQFRNKVNGGYVTFGEAYVVGILITLIIAAISTVNLAIFLQTHPGFQEKVIEQTRIQMVNKGMTQDQIDMALTYTRKFTTPTIMTIFGFIGGVMGGAVMALLSSGISVKKKPMFEEGSSNDTTTTVQ